MTSTQAAVKIKNGVNKLDSKDYPNIPLWKIEEAVNTAAIWFCRERIESKEANIKMIGDLQVLLKDVRLSGSNRSTYFLSHKLPTDYLGYSSVTPICNKGACMGIRITSSLKEDASKDDLLGDYSSQPSFDFEQTFHTIGGNKIKQYHNNDFEVKELELSYYRTPQYITFPGTPQINGGIGKDMTWEFNEGVCEVIIEKAVKILSGNIENNNRFQIAQNNLQELK